MSDVNVPKPVSVYLPYQQGSYVVVEYMEGVYHVVDTSVLQDYKNTVAAADAGVVPYTNILDIDGVHEINDLSEIEIFEWRFTNRGDDDTAQ